MWRTSAPATVALCAILASSAHAQGFFLDFEDSIIDPLVITAGASTVVGNNAAPLGFESDKALATQVNTVAGWGLFESGLPFVANVEMVVEFDLLLTGSSVRRVDMTPQAPGRGATSFGDVLFTISSGTAITFKRRTVSGDTPITETPFDEWVHVRFVYPPQATAGCNYDHTDVWINEIGPTRLNITNCDEAGFNWALYTTGAFDEALYRLDNVRAGPAVAPLPNLVLAGLGIRNGVLEATVENQGTGAVDVRHLNPCARGYGGHTYIWIDDMTKPKWTYSWCTLSDVSFGEVGGRATIRPQVLDGCHRLRACVDPNGRVAELSEDDNCLIIERAGDCAATNAQSGGAKRVVSVDNPCAGRDSCFTCSLAPRCEWRNSQCRPCRGDCPAAQCKEESDLVRPFVRAEIPASRIPKLPGDRVLDPKVFSSKGGRPLNPADDEPTISERIRMFDPRPLRAALESRKSVFVIDIDDDASIQFHMDDVATLPGDVMRLMHGRNLLLVARTWIRGRLFDEASQRLFEVATLSSGVPPVVSIQEIDASKLPVESSDHLPDPLLLERQQQGEPAQRREAAKTTESQASSPQLLTSCVLKGNAPFCKASRQECTGSKPFDWGLEKDNCATGHKLKCCDEAPPSSSGSSGSGGSSGTDALDCELLGSAPFCNGGDISCSGEQPFDWGLRNDNCVSGHKRKCCNQAPPDTGSGSTPEPEAEFDCIELGNSPFCGGSNLECSGSHPFSWGLDKANCWTGKKRICCNQPEDDPQPNTGTDCILKGNGPFCLGSTKNCDDEGVYMFDWGLERHSDCVTGHKRKCCAHEPPLPDPNNDLECELLGTAPFCSGRHRKCEGEFPHLHGYEKDNCATGVKRKCCNEPLTEQTCIFEGRKPFCGGESVKCPDQFPFPSGRFDKDDCTTGTKRECCNTPPEDICTIKILILMPSYVSPCTTGDASLIEADRLAYETMINQVWDAPVGFPTGVNADVAYECIDFFPEAPLRNSACWYRDWLAADTDADALRTSHGADLVQVMVPSRDETGSNDMINMSDPTGPLTTKWANGGCAHNPGYPLPNGGKPMKAYSATLLKNAFTQYTTTHEFGHNFGMNHNHDFGGDSTKGCQYGFYWSDKTARSNMAYPDKDNCPSCSRAPEYSNPLLGERVHGISCDQSPIISGKFERANNRQVLIDGARDICEYRSPPSSGPSGWRPPKGFPWKPGKFPGPIRFSCKTPAACIPTTTDPTRTPLCPDCPSDLGLSKFDPIENFFDPGLGQSDPEIIIDSTRNPWVPGGGRLQGEAALRPPESSKDSVRFVTGDREGPGHTVVQFEVGVVAAGSAGVEIDLMGEDGSLQGAFQINKHFASSPVIQPAKSTVLLLQEEGTNSTWEEQNTLVSWYRLRVAFSETKPIARVFLDDKSLGGITTEGLKGTFHEVRIRSTGLRANRSRESGVVFGRVTFDPALQPARCFANENCASCQSQSGCAWRRGRCMKCRRPGGCMAKVCTPNAFPDLIVSDLTVNAAGVAEVTFNNVGDAPVPSERARPCEDGQDEGGVLALYVDDQADAFLVVSMCQMEDLDFLAVGGKTSLPFKRLEGCHTLRACVDAAGVIDESDETNNCLTKKNVCAPGSNDDDAPVGLVLRDPRAGIHLGDETGGTRIGRDDKGRTSLNRMTVDGVEILDAIAALSQRIDSMQQQASELARNSRSAIGA